MADAVTYQLLYETSKRALIKLTNVSDGSGETNVLKVNTANLAFAYSTIPVVFAGGNVFKMGETVYASNNVSQTAIATNFVPETKTLFLTSVNALADWSNARANLIIAGVTSNVQMTQNVAGNIVAANTRVDVEGCLWSVSGGKSVVLAWADASTNVVCETLAYTGCVTPNQAPNYKLINNAAAPTGGLNFTTKGFAANDTYTVVLDLRKSAGYLDPQKEKNPGFGYLGVN
jgi:hypothetical protein